MAANFNYAYRYNKSLQLFVGKRHNFNQNNQHHISLNSQFDVALNDMICFSVQFSDKSLLVVKILFQFFFFFFFFLQEKMQGFLSDRKKKLLLAYLPSLVNVKY